MIITSLLLYSIFVIGISALRSRQQGADEFLMVGHKASALPVAASLFTLIGGGELITLTALSFVFGFAGLALFIGYALAFIFIGIFASRVRGAHWQQSFSMPDYIHSVVGSRAGLIAAIVSIVAFFSVLILQFVALENVLTPITGLSEGVIRLYIAATIVFYLALGGFRSVLRTDIIQGATMILLLGVILFIYFSGSNTTVVYEYAPMSLSLWASLIIAGFFGGAASADVWQRALAAQSDSTARWGFIAGGFLLLIYGVLISYIAFFAHGVGLENADTAFADMMTGYLPGWALPVVALLMVSAIMSTADTQLFLLAGMIEREHRRLKGKMFAWTDRWNDVMLVRYLIFALAALAVGMATWFDNIVGIYTWLFSVFTIVAPFIVLSLFMKLQQSEFIGALLVNTVLFVILIWAGYINLDNLYMVALTGSAIHALVYAIGLWRAGGAPAN